MDKLSTTKGFSFFYTLLLLLAFTIPLSQYASSVLVLIICLFSFFLGDTQASLLRFLGNSWDICLYMLILLLGLTYSEDIQSGFGVLETNLSLIAVPLIFSRITDLNEKKVNQLFYSFTLGLCLACTIYLGNALIIFIKTGNKDSFFFYNLTDILNFQPTYLAYYLIFVITFGLYQFYYQKIIDSIIIKAGIILFLFIVLMLTGGQTAFISMLLIFAFFILKFLIEEKSKVKRLTIALIIFMLLDMFLTAMISKGERAMSLSDSWDRLVLWESAINAIPNPLFGVGTGDYKAALNQYYMDHDLIRFATESYNSHNQFIQTLLSNGVLGVIALILMIVRPLYLFSRNENILGILSLFPFLIYGMTEVFLGRYQGIVFFTFIHQFFIVQLNSKKNPIC